MVVPPPVLVRLDRYAAVFPSGLQVKNPTTPATGVLGDPERGVRTRPLLESTYETADALTN
jgi:hypothetical protein